MRTLTAEEIAATTGYAVYPAWLFEFYLAQPVYLCSTVYDLQDEAFGGIVYLGRGGVGKVDDIRDSAGEFPQLKMTLSGVPDEYIALADDTNTAGCELVVKAALFRESDRKVISTRTRFVGTLEPMTINDADRGAALEVIAESDAHTLLRPLATLFTDAEQQRLYPGDLFFQYTADQADQKLIWPAASWGRQ